MGARKRCAQSECRHSPAAHREDGSCLSCKCAGWIDSKPHTWRQDCFDAWFMATHAWSLQAEAAAVGYATELAEFAEKHPRPRLGDFMEALSLGSPPEKLDALWPPKPCCPECRGTGLAA